MGGHLYMSAGPYGLLPGNLKFLRGHQFWPDIAHTSVIMGGGVHSFQYECETLNTNIYVCSNTYYTKHSFNSQWDVFKVKCK